VKDRKKIWYSVAGGVNPDRELRYYQRKNLDFCHTLTEHSAIIITEINDYLNKEVGSIKPYFNESMVERQSKKSHWRTNTFFLWLWRVKKNERKCPKTIKIVRKIEGVLSCSISLLNPGVDIKEHHGDTNAIMRCHFPIQVPDGLPKCGFSVNGEERSWEEGKPLVFNDSAPHKAWNHSDRDRVVLIIDVVRPEFAKKKYWISSRVLSSLLVQSLLGKITFLKKLPKFILGGLYFAIAGIIYLILRIKSLF
jgi:hypothetical protein